MGPSNRLILAMLFLAASLPLWPGMVAAQFQQYTPPGGIGQEPEDTEKQLDEAVEGARWRLGAIRVDPWIALRDAGFRDNVFATEQQQDSDFTASLGAGLRFYLPTGRKAVFAAHVLPEYVWWQDLEERRRLNGRFGAAYFGFFNRLTIQATATRQEALDVLTPEVAQQVNNRVDLAALTAELALGSRLSIFASGRSLESTTVDDAIDPRVPRFASLDRSEEVVRAGFAYRASETLRIAVGVEDSQVDFDDPLSDRSNSGTSTVVEIDYDSPRLAFNLDAADRSLDPDGDSSIFVPFGDPTGKARIAFKAGESLELELYGSRTLVYALSSDYSYFEDNRRGLALLTGVSRRGALRLFYEDGDNDYRIAAGGAPERIDDARSYGGELTFQIAGSLVFTAGFSASDFDSNLPGLDRDVSFVRLGLALGKSGSPWW